MSEIRRVYIPRPCGSKHILFSTPSSCILMIEYVTGVLLSYYHSFNSPLYSYIVIQSFGIEVVEEVTVRC